MTIVTQVDLLRHRRTKIIATIGPASQASDRLQQLIRLGVDVFRLNMSHGDHATHRASFARIRALAEREGRHVAILADLCGPKIRCGRFRNGGAALADGAAVRVTAADVLGDAATIPSQYRALARDVRPGHRLLLSDGELQLEVERRDGDDLHCRVVHGGLLKDHKGINLPDSAVSAPSLTGKDRLDAELMLELGADFLALSFVRRAEDIAALRRLCGAASAEAAIIAKIEKPEALDNSAAILDAADGIMIARGDLGVELPAEQVPIAQTQLIDRACAANKPVIVATQMLESMLQHARPTRAEVTDVSHAVASGADAVMLSGETAAGAYPLRAVEIMDRVIRQTESYLWQQRASDPPPRISQQPPVPFGDALADATAHLSFDLQVRAVVVISNSGMSAVTVSSARPSAPVIVVSHDPRTSRRMSLLWGVLPLVAGDVGSANPNHVARRVAVELGIAGPGDSILLVRGFHADPELNTPSVTVLTIP